jgi:hypothetical protein
MWNGVDKKIYEICHFYEVWNVTIVIIKNNVDEEENYLKSL